MFSQMDALFNDFCKDMNDAGINEGLFSKFDALRQNPDSPEFNQFIDSLSIDETEMLYQSLNKKLW